MDFSYYVPYVVVGPNSPLDGLIVKGASQTGQNTFTFYTDPESTKPVVSILIAATEKLADGSVQTLLDDGSELLFKPLSVADVQKDPTKYYLSPEEGASVQRESDLYLLFHAAVVPDEYAAKYGPAREISEAVESDYALLTEQRGSEAPVGTIHFWASRNRWFKKMEDGSWLELKEGPNWVAAHPDLPTNSLRANMVDGELTPVRKRLHKGILDRIFTGLTRTKQPVAIFTMGLPASGKSALSSFIGRRDRKDNVAVLDPDNHRSSIPEYQAAVQLKARNGAKVVHEEVTYVNDMALEEALTPDESGARFNFLLDGVGGNLEWYQQTIERAKKAGYKVSLFYAHTGGANGLNGEDTLKVRAEDRGITEGRFADTQQISRLYPVLPENFRKLSALVDEAAAFDMTDTNNPTELYARKGDKETGDSEWARR